MELMNMYVLHRTDFSPTWRIFLYRWQTDESWLVSKSAAGLWFAV